MLVIKRMEFTHCTQLKTMMTNSYTIGDIYVNVRLEKLSQQKPGVVFAVHLILCKYQGELSGGVRVYMEDGGSENSSMGVSERF